MRGLTTHCRRDPRNTKGDKTNSLGLLSAWAPWRSEVGGWCGGSLVAAPLGWEALRPFMQHPAQRPSHIKPHHKDTTGDDCSRTAPHPCAAIREHCHTLAQPHAGFHSFHFISFHFISFHFISFHFISFHFISFHFISFHFSFHFISFHFISFHFISFHFISFHSISFHSIPFHFISFHSAASLNARAARARTSEARVTPHAVHTRASFLKCGLH